MSNPDNLPRKAPVALEDCGAARALDVVPDRWTWLILRHLMYGVGRFADIQDDIGIPKSVLSARLAALVDQGLADKQPYRDGTARTRHAYVLTRKGRGLVPVILALMHWGDTHLKDGESALALTDRRTGAPLRVALTPEDAALPLRRLRYRPVQGRTG
ncbi:helix-turn-helix domain-containing protein [uncultured Tateyamaria sp.]|uniref:winged helix-turn-helix transcriptional regulator n=1 Tax=Tateyamaria sp. 1078 TaxID=3417464 RepID=UPI00260F8DD1|nr:helix-turn-helix domain-containing protein [uncultured Tateyamaria sp.]